MSKRVITIGRQYGSNGRKIAQELADALGIHFYDKELIRLAGERSDISYEELVKVDEKRPSPWMYPINDSIQMERRFRYEPMNDVLFEAQKRIIRELSEKEDCIIVGRGANHILKDHDKLLRVFFYAPLESRIETVMDRTGLDSKDASALIRKIDRQRMYYYSTYTDEKWDDFSQYDFYADTTRFPKEKMIPILSQMYQLL